MGFEPVQTFQRGLRLTGDQPQVFERETQVIDPQVFDESPVVPHQRQLHLVGRSDHVLRRSGRLVLPELLHLRPVLSGPGHPTLRGQGPAAVGVDAALLPVTSQSGSTMRNETAAPNARATGSGMSERKLCHDQDSCHSAAA